VEDKRERKRIPANPLREVEKRKKKRTLLIHGKRSIQGGSPKEKKMLCRERKNGEKRKGGGERGKRFFMREKRL